MTLASADAASRLVNRKKMAPAAVPAHAGHPTCRKYNTTYTHAHKVDEGRVRMKPVKTGSPVASVYRITSMLKIVCSVTAIPTTQSNDRPWRTKAAGPSRNSPLPIAAPSTMTPGPVTLSHSRPRGVGGAGSSARVHGSKPERVSAGGDWGVYGVTKGHSS